MPKPLYIPWYQIAEWNWLRKFDVDFMLFPSRILKDCSRLLLFAITFRMVDFILFTGLLLFWDGLIFLLNSTIELSWVVMYVL